MSDYEMTVAMLERASQPYFCYTQVGVSGDFKVMVLDEDKDGGRHVPLLFFNLDDGTFVKAETRWLDP